MDRDQAVTIIRSVGRTCRGPLPAEAREIITRLLHEDKPEEARNLDANVRTRCGYDFNEIVVAGPWDGQEYPYTCPQCGVQGSYRAPVFELA